ncbi:thioredoxin domain-containing protein [Mesorhizobium sp. L-8-10]|uniref:thioredoxin domain-containing protein n=1 Tax=Mesorhizobium sp. L-8-10 TaxID=2744523 RepID=UPI0019296DA1|nr:thioredoxin domain-containing protein [Mesorhizobium sp. L-8-10]BCH29242.1 thioredoxin domain-containing protein [Mesorhizobium sp. L-8-10]
MPLSAANLLSEETSPYLRQHKDNPVHWRAWSTEALAEAQALDRPILLSVGYAACHWCHVMAHESFEDDGVAAVMNRLFVNIKVDREERPDIDQIYMAALNATGEQGGWPLTMFLTPDAKPFWGGTYFPKLPRYGRPGFVQVLESVHRAWRDKRGELARSADALTDHVSARLAGGPASTTIDPTQLATLAAGVQDMIDRQRGGLRGAPKFPNAPFMRVLWQYWLTSGNREHRDSVLLSLREMLKGGIYDHVGGGLSRYSTDADWLVPHFEKMLYDNAQLLQSLGWAYAATKDELFGVRIKETVGWLLREMRVDGGGFASSLDADSEGEEGLFYTWDRSEIESILGESSTRFLSIYGLAAPDGWEGKPVLHIEADDLTPVISAEFVSARQKLFHARAGRIRPGRDDKVLADWNGLTIAALAGVGRLLDRPDWIAAAAAAYRFVIGSSDDAGRLPHSILDDRRLYPAMSSDYAAMINASITLFEATSEASYIATARNFADKLETWYTDQSGHGYYLSASDSADLLMRIRGDVDEAVPSATAQIIEALTRLAVLTGDLDLQSKAWAAAEAASGRAAQLAYGQAGIVYAAALALDPWKLVTVDAPGSRAFACVADAASDPRRVDIRLTAGDKTSAPALPGGIVPDIARPGAWLCRGNGCLPVITEPAELRSALIQP